MYRKAGLLSGQETDGREESPAIPKRGEGGVCARTTVLPQRTNPALANLLPTLSTALPAFLLLHAYLLCSFLFFCLS